ncbi:Ribosome maturation factor RimP [Kordia antarctica]|uniref:Ribosome maturation factor RimP n=1 Tax=Kordia antarctica TaxID=1218801 RepID=A0A7L4ZNV8_9FLAO|nr:ribosome assembly cofactor RimP [Kordia antarctica]QHI38157.1 Ribosome maturation factor RimP [Kordia antarctica]
MLKEKVNSLLQEVLDEDQSLFLISKEITAGNKIVIVIDGDNGVTLSDCMKVSRNIEHNLDREEEDFSLEVYSSGVSEGITHIRQYKKNMERKLEVTTTGDKKVEGTLVAVDDEKIKLQWEAREPKPIGKGKVTVQKEQEIPYTDIVKAKVMVTF